MNVIPFDPPRVPEPKCSFCSMPKSATKRLIGNAEETKHICDKCVDKANALLK